MIQREERILPGLGRIIQALAALALVGMWLLPSVSIGGGKTNGLAVVSAMLCNLRTLLSDNQAASVGMGLLLILLPSALLMKAAAAKRPGLHLAAALASGAALLISHLTSHHFRGVFQPEVGTYVEIGAVGAMVLLSIVRISLYHREPSVACATCGLVRP